MNYGRVVFEDDAGSPSTNLNDLTTLKIEDLDEKGRTPGGVKKEGYNPVWKL